MLLFLSSKVISTGVNVRFASTIKSNNIFEQARNLSDRSDSKKNKKKYYSSSDSSDSDSDKESRKKVCK
jgi:hypothetical protein